MMHARKKKASDAQADSQVAKKKHTENFFGQEDMRNMAGRETDRLTDRQSGKQAGKQT